MYWQNKKGISSIGTQCIFSDAMSEMVFKSFPDTAVGAPCARSLGRSPYRWACRTS